MKPLLTTFLETTGAVYGPVGSVIEAKDLDRRHIGQLIHFAYQEDVTALEILVLGELREVRHTIHHDGEGTSHEVIIWVTGRDSTGGDKREFTIDHQARLVFVAD